MAVPLVSICVPHYNHVDDLLKPFLQNMLDTTEDFVEIIIADNGSTDVTPDVLRDYGKISKGRIRFVELGTNKGFAGGSNAAFKEAKGEYIIFLNNDVLAKKKGWVTDMLRVAKLQNNRAVIGPEIVKNNEWTTVLNYGPVTYVNGWCMMFHRSQLEDIGVFDQRMGQAFFEDVELCDRAVKAGYNLVQINDLGLIHLGSQTVKDFNADALTKKAQRYYKTKIILNRVKATGKKRIVFYLPNNYPFIDSDWEGKGVGGAEYALISLTRMLAKLGWEVWIYNKCQVQGTFNGVNYAHVSTFDHSNFANVFVLFREPIHSLEYVNSPIKLFWSCDQHTTGNWQDQIYPFIDKIVAISPYHKRYLERNKDANPEFVEMIDLGIDLDSYIDPLPKVPGKLIFCSVPKRGLAEMEYLFPKIRARVPNATLVITSDYTLWGVDDPDNHYERTKLERMAGVQFLGKIPRAELVKHQLEAEVMVYPCNYEEMFCIAAAECIAAGAIPVTTPIGALTTTVADSGILIRRGMGPDYTETFVNAVVDLLTDEALKAKLSVEGRTRMLTYYNWKVIAERWIDLFREISEYKEEGGEHLWQPTPNFNSVR